MVPKQASGTHSSMLGPKPGHPVCSSSCYSLLEEDPRAQVSLLLSCIPSWGEMSHNRITSLSFPSDATLQTWLHGSHSASLQLVFSEDCATCRCVFDVFLVGDELRVLLCHFHPLLGTGALVIFSSPKKSGYFYIALDNLIFLLVWIS